MKLKREANSFQKTSSEAPTNTMTVHRSRSTDARTTRRPPGRRSGHQASRAARGSAAKAATPRSKTAPIAIAGRIRQGRNSEGSPLYTASARRVSALNARNATMSTRRIARREGNSTASAERRKRCMRGVLSHSPGQDARYLREARMRYDVPALTNQEENNHVRARTWHPL